MSTSILARVITTAAVAITATSLVTFSAQADSQQPQNPREHLAHRDVAGGPAPCAAALAQAWERLGHYSDGYERYLLTQAPCA